MSMIMSPRRRQAEDFQALLDGGRASTPEAAAELAALVGLARTLAPSDVRPRPEFRTALREQLLTEAAAREPAPRALVTVDRERPSAGHRVRQAVAAVAVTSVVVGAGAAAASTRALPGDTLYGLKRGVENAQLALAQGDVGRGRELLEQADARLGEAEALAAGEDSSSPQTRDRLAGALADMDAAVTAAADDLTRAYRETGDAEPMQLLAQFVAEQQDRLADLATLLDPQLRDEVRALQDRLAGLGEQTSAVLGLALEGSSGTTSGGTGTGSGGSVGSTVDRAARGGAGGAPGAGAAGGAAGSAATGGATGATDAVGGVVGSLTGGSTGGSGGSGTSGGTTSGGGLLGGNATSASSAPLPSNPVGAVTSAVPLPLPTSTPLVTDPVSVVTSAVPLPSASPLPSVSVSVCVPVPPLTAC
jgi:hypothetical protein